MSSVFRGSRGAGQPAGANVGVAVGQVRPAEPGPPQGRAQLEDGYGNDLSLLASTIPLTPAERIERFLQLVELSTELRAAVSRARSGG